MATTTKTDEYGAADATNHSQTAQIIADLCLLVSLVGLPVWLGLMLTGYVTTSAAVMFGMIAAQAVVLRVRPN